MANAKNSASKAFKGKVVKTIRRLTDKEMEQFGWDNYNGAPVLIFEDGSWIVPSSDYEGNNSGAFFTSDEVHHTI